jgi:glycosyltransferase involved in cell wall biosynthesis
MRFTIAIPTYNNFKTIKKSIDSCLNQDYTEPFEVLVVNNASTDDTDKLLDSFGDKITRFSNDTTVSLFENHNVCIRQAKGDYVVFCHSDDQLLPDALSKYHLILEKRGFPNKYVLWGRSMFRDFYHNWNNGGFQLNQIASGYSAISVFHIGGITPSGTCYSKESFLDFGGFFEMKDKVTPSDQTTMWALCLNAFEFEMADRVFFIRELASTAHSLNNKLYLDSYQGALDVLITKLDERDLKVIISNLLSFKNNFNPILINALIQKKITTKNQVRRLILKYLLKNPSFFVRVQYLKLLF